MTLNQDLRGHGAEVRVLDFGVGCAALHLGFPGIRVRGQVHHVNDGSRHGGTSLLYVGILVTGFNAFKWRQFTQESRDYLLMMTWQA